MLGHYPIFRDYKITKNKIFSFRDQLYVDSIFDIQSSQIDFYHGNIFKGLFLGNFINTSSLVIRKEVASSVGEFNTSLKTQELILFY